MIKAEDFKWLDRVYHLFHLGSSLCLSGALTDCFLPLPTSCNEISPNKLYGSHNDNMTDALCTAALLGSSEEGEHL